MTALFAALVNGALISFPLALVVWLALRMAPHRLLNAATRYVVWWALLLVTIALPVCFLPAPPQPALLPPVYVAPPEPASAPLPSPIVSIVEPPSAPTSEAPTPRFHRPAFPIHISANPWTRWIPIGWLSLAAVLLMRLAASWTQLQRFSRRAVDAPSPLRERVDHWLSLCRSRRRGVRLAISADIAMPAAVGPLRPSILIPRRLFAEMDERAMHQIGLHETAHLARHDDYALLLQRILEALFVLHPVARWIARQIDLQREIACDDFVLVAAGESYSYASCLTRVVELSAGARSPMAAAATGSRSQLSERVELLLDKTRHCGTHLLKLRLATAFLALAGLSWMAGRAPGVLAFAGPAGGMALQLLMPGRGRVPLFLAQVAPPPPATPPPTKADEFASVAGRVTNAATGEPLKKATIVLRGARAAFSSTTEVDGTYRLVNLDPDSYTVLVACNGFLRGDYGFGQGSAPLTLSPGQRRTAVDFKLAPEAVITGHIRNADGEPVPNQVVGALGIRYATGQKDLFAFASCITNDLGEYRLTGLRAGKYFLISRNISILPGTTETRGFDRSARPRQEDYVMTYYPGVTTAATAALVEVSAGAPAEGFDFKLARSHVTRLHGRVLNRTGVTGATVSVTLSSPADAGFIGATTHAGPQGDFEFAGVAPGGYTVIAEINGGRPFRTEQEVVIGNDPVENLVLRLEPGVEIPGSIRSEDGELDPHSLKIRIRTQWQRNGDPMPEDAPDEAGNFRLNMVNPNRYMVAIDNLPDGFYLKSAQMGSQDVLEKGLDLIHGGPAPLQLVVSGKAAALNGSVVDRNDSPVPHATVALVPEDAGRRGQQIFYRSLESDPSGNFKLKNLIPGKYRLFAWEEVEDRAWVDSEFLKQFAARSTAVEVREGGSDTVNLHVIPKGAGK